MFDLHMCTFLQLKGIIDSQTAVLTTLGRVRRRVAAPICQDASYFDDGIFLIKVVCPPRRRSAVLRVLFPQSPHHESRHPEPRYFPGGHARLNPIAQLSNSLTCSSPVARKIPFDNPEVLLYVRIGYVAVQVIVLGVYYYISMAVRLIAFTVPAPHSCPP